MTQVNPLAPYFRTAGVHQMLSTAGRFFEEGEIELAVNGEVGVLPMTASDEIVLKNPDALLNGDALERLFHSCVPAIKNPRRISVPDIDILLLAIKLASTGDELAINVTCPECKHEWDMGISIRGILDHAKPIPEELMSVRINDEMIAHLRPYDFESKTILDLATFEEQKLYQHLMDSEMSDQEKAKSFNRSFERIAELNLDLLSKCIRRMVIPSGEVTDPKFIREWVAKANRTEIRKINENLKEMSKCGVDRTLEVTCPQDECHHEWTTALVFDPAHFFA